MKKMTMLDYVKETPQIALENINNYISLTDELVSITPENLDTVWLVASGSSHNACYCARMFMKKCLNKEVKIVTPYTFTYYENDIKDNDLVCVITQSGLSTNSIEALKKIKKMNKKAICLTGNINSDVKDVADIVINYGVGAELVGYVTKGVTTLCLFLMLFSIRIAHKEEYLDQLKRAVNLNREMVDKTLDFIEINYKELSSMSWSYCCAGGANYGVALEGALKIGETIHIPSCAYEIEEYIHGPNLQLTPQYNVFLFDCNDIASSRVQQIYLATKEVTNRTFMISNNKIFKDDNHVIYFDDELMSEVYPIAYLPFVQLVSYIISKDTNRVYQHPLLKKFKTIAAAKTENFVNYDGDD